MKTIIRILTLCACTIGAAVAADAPTDEEVGKGLQTALGKLVGETVSTSTDEKTADAQMTVNLPDKLKKLESALSAVGESQLMNDFKAKIKDVAVKALPVTGDTLKAETSGLKVDDPMTVLKTGPDGLTTYAKKHTRAPVIAKVQPVVAQKIKDNGLADSYKNMVSKAGPFASSIFGKEMPASIEQTVTEQTVDYVYAGMSKGEAALRADPNLSKDKLVKKIFSYVKK